MPLLPKTGGLHGRRLDDITFLDFQKKMCEEWFQSDTSFKHYIIDRRVLDSNGQNVSLTLRAIALMLRTGIILGMHKCTECNGPTRLECSNPDGCLRYRWTCRTSGHKHMNAPVNFHGFMKEITISNWLAFLHMLNMLRLGMPWVHIINELQFGYGNIKEHTMTQWRRSFQQALGRALKNMDQMMIGGLNYTVVIDECLVGTHPEDGWSMGNNGINKSGYPQERSNVRSETPSMKKAQGMKVLPARTLRKGESKAAGSYTLLKKPAAVMKRPSAAVKRPSTFTSMKRPAAHRRPLRVLKKPAQNLKLNGKWLWLAVCVGRGSKVFTHGNGLKKITYRLLPRTSQAVNNKPRGLHEIRDTLHSRVRKHSTLVFDGWTATTKAADQLGYKHPPSVKHDKCFRDVATGFHTNDAESENNRLKKWSRQRHGYLRIEEPDMQEYMFYVNVGSSMMSVLEGLARSNEGGKCRNAFIAI